MSHTLATACFWGLFGLRYARNIVGIPTVLIARTKVAEMPSRYSAKDVSVIIPTTAKSLRELEKCLATVTACSPAAIFIITNEASIGLVNKLLCSFSEQPITLLNVAKFNKREQILKALPLVRTPISILADDDVRWPPGFLEYLLPIFNDPVVGAGGPRQSVRREPNPSFWNFLGICYLERRAWNNMATNMVDGSISTLSGRTAAYRTGIIQTSDFEAYFMKERGGQGKPNSGDDKALTQYVYSQGWKIALQPDSRATIETTLERDCRYMLQCVRWARSHWSGNFAVMKEETYWYSRQYLWGLYYIYISQFQVPVVLFDGLLFFLLSIMVEQASQFTANLCYAALTTWILFMKVVKLIPHFCKFPADIRFIPVSILFCYVHGFLSLYGAFTMHYTGWGSQRLD
ncbi:putative polysaccharide synthase Cps1 [Xylariaceae sp. FL0594]|nr:putative polysaccharide synthase Cps1 [Xylariaceae sp. FL0594]